MTVRQRVADLQAAIEARHSDRPPTVTITCSSCGRVDAVEGPNLDHPEALFADWQLGDERPYGLLPGLFAVRADRAKAPQTEHATATDQVTVTRSTISTSYLCSILFG